jgi:hypothetical protein
MGTLAALQMQYLQSECEALDRATHLSSYAYNTEVAWIQDCVGTLSREFEMFTAFLEQDEVNAFATQLASLKAWLECHVLDV